MKKLMMMSAIVALGIFYSCGDEKEPVTPDPDPVAPALTAPADGSTSVVTAENLATAFTVSWEEADFGASVAVSYSVEIDTAGNEFADAAVLGTTTDATLESTLGDLNDLILNDLDLVPNVAVKLELRVVASSTGFDDLVSDEVGLMVTSFFEETEAPVVYPKIYIAGSYQGWNITAPDSIASVEDNGVYEGYVYFPAAEDIQFKLYAQVAWEPLSWGATEGVEGKIEVANCACLNFHVPEAGYYLLSVDLNELTYILIKTNWGIIGGATPTGWDSSTDMTYDETTKTWSVTADMIANGSFKFRANNEWVLDFGIDANGKLTYANHPWKEYFEAPQLTVAEDGNYTIVLDLHNPDNYTYSITKN